MDRLTNEHWCNDDPWELCGLGSDCKRGCVNAGEWCKVALKLRRLAAYEDAEQDGRLVVLPDRNDEIVHAIEVALRIKLYDWQKAYIFGASNYLMRGRVTGKTTAYMLRLLLSAGPPIHLYRFDVLQEVCDEYHGFSYYSWFKSKLRDMYWSLSTPGLGISLRTIKFSDKECRDAKRESRPG